MSAPSADRILAGAERPAPEPFRRPSGRVSYPRRVTLDLDDERYEWLKETAWELRIPGGIAGLLRATIDLLSRDDEAALLGALAAQFESHRGEERVSRSN